TTAPARPKSSSPNTAPAPPASSPSPGAPSTCGSTIIPARWNPTADTVSVTNRHARELIRLRVCPGSLIRRGVARPELAGLRQQQDADTLRCQAWRDIPVPRTRLATLLVAPQPRQF